MNILDEDEGSGFYTKKIRSKKQPKKGKKKEPICTKWRLLVSISVILFAIGFLVLLAGTLGLLMHR
jgi:hypothetical protein